jgi:hypothetical protein
MGTHFSPSRGSLRKLQALFLFACLLVGGVEPITNDTINSGAARVVRTRVNRRLTATSVTTFTELEAAVGNGEALVDVAVGAMNFSTQIIIASGNTVEVYSAVSMPMSMSTVLNGGSAVRFFYVNGGDLTLRALSLAYGATPTDECDSPFTSCGGGAIYVSATGSLVLINCIVEDNVAFLGGAILLFSGGSAVVAGSSFVGNSVPNCGGAIWLRDDSTATIESSSFTDNVAVSNGGAIWAYSGASAEVQGSRFVGNRAGYAGGAMYVYHWGSVASVESSTFTDNYAPHVGGAFGGGECSVTITTSFKPPAPTARCAVVSNER